MKRESETDDIYRRLSLWHDEFPGSLDPRPALDVDVDVAIIGGGYTGLWTAYYLLSHGPTLRVLVIERDIVGFGASGRNGGWCVGEVAASHSALFRASGPEAAVKVMRAAMDSVDEVGRIVDAEGIECGFVKGGTFRLAPNGAQSRLQREIVKHHRSTPAGPGRCRPIAGW